MPLISVILILVVVGVLLWLVNTYVSQYMSAAVLKLLNVVVIIVLVLWLLQLFIGPIEGIRIGR